MVHRALIVDDSRSARTLLKRLLENFGLAVHAVESAEQALTWLQQERPDVIFMDHLMPGMDGFAAVKVIKSDPQTASIPVLMYTSQEGALYLSQARALGAMGVLPKTLKSADVADVLRQLNMLKAVPANGQAADRPSIDKVVVETPEAMAPSAGRIEPGMSAPKANETHQHQLAHRIAVELRTELPLLGADLEGMLTFWRRAAITMAALLVLTLVAVLYLQVQLHQLSGQWPARATTSAAAPSIAASALSMPEPSATSGATSSASAPLSTVVATEPVAYGEVPLSGARLERLRSLVAQQRNKRATTVIQVQVFQADFCLYATGSIYQLAPDDWLVSRCELVGNPFGDALSVEQRQSVAFANFVNSINAGQGNVVIDLQDRGRQAVASYPVRTDTLTAGEWNAVALRNQRVEFALLTSH